MFGPRSGLPSISESCEEEGLGRLTQVPRGSRILTELSLGANGGDGVPHRVLSWGSQFAPSICTPKTVERHESDSGQAKSFGNEELGRVELKNAGAANFIRGLLRRSDGMSS
jgi:hypothetical protein